jgi:hypothetical protein
MTTRWARFIRGWIAAAVSVFVALFSHTLAGGAVPSVAGVALCLAFAGMTCIALAGKSLSLPRLSLSVFISQLLFHGWFSLLGSAGTPTITSPATTPSMATEMGEHQMQLQAAGSVMTMPTWMWAAHATAAVLTVLVLRYGERAFWQLIALARPFLLSLFGWVLGTPLPMVRSVPREQESLPRRLAIVSMLSLRGPPGSAL